MQYIPEAFWIALAGLLSGLSVHFTHKVRRSRREARALPEEIRITEKLRLFVETLAADQAARAVRPLVTKVDEVQKHLDRVETDLRSHMARTQSDVQAFYVLTAKLTVEVTGLRDDMAKNTAALGELTRAVGQLEGAR